MYHKTNTSFDKFLLSDTLVHIIKLRSIQKVWRACKKHAGLCPGGVLSIMAYTGRLCPKRGTVFILQVYERVGISRVKADERVEKSL